MNKIDKIFKKRLLVIHEPKFTKQIWITTSKHKWLTFIWLQNASDVPGLQDLMVVRMDHGKSEFDRRYGYDKLSSIQEHVENRDHDRPRVTCM